MYMRFFKKTNELGVVAQSQKWGGRGRESLNLRPAWFKVSCKIARALSWKTKPNQDEFNYLVGVIRQKRQGCGNAALGRQQTGILTHLLSQKSSYSIRIHGVGKLHSFSEDDNFFNQILNDKIRQSEIPKNQISKHTKCTVPVHILLEKHGKAEHHLSDGQRGGRSSYPMDSRQGGGGCLILMEDT